MLSADNSGFSRPALGPSSGELSSGLQTVSGSEASIRSIHFPFAPDRL